MSEEQDLKIPAFLRNKKGAASRKKPKPKGKRKAKPKKKPAAKKAPVLRKKVAKKAPKKAAAKKAKPAPKPKKKPAAKKAKPKIKEQQKRVAKITHYFDKIKVAILKIEEPISVGDTLVFKGTTNLKQEITSMQFEHEQIKKAKKGQEVGIKVKKELSPGDQVFLL